MKKLSALIPVLMMLLTVPAFAAQAACVHDYESGVCSVCGEAHPNLANYAGKVVSVLGASICTFDGYIPTADGFNLTHRARYPQDNLLTDVNETWWMQVVKALDAKLGINDSWAGSQVLNTLDTNSGDSGPDACLSSMTRIRNLGSNGTPDVILFFGGTNDITRRSPLGTFDPAAAPAQPDLTSETWSTVADSYTALIMRVQHFYPDAQFVVCLPYSTSANSDTVTEQYTAVFAEICAHYGVTCVDLNDCGITLSDLPDGTHPNAAGMDCITEMVLDALLTDGSMAAGENVVHSVTHDLTGAESSKSYYKGISHGATFSTALSGEDLSVTVTMGGADITASCYADGAVNIERVTGDVVITASGKVKTVYEDYLQPLPSALCPGVNLWNALEPVQTYYTAAGWGNTAAGTSWSITFPVEPGDQIWATSFGAYPDNGSTANGIRVTWFGEDGVLATLSRETVYAEFAANGCITAPEGAVALNVPMTNPTDNCAVYILNCSHAYQNDTCAACGETQPAPYRLNAITLHSMSGDKLTAIPAGNFWAGISLTKLVETGDVTVLLAAYDADGRFLRMLCAAAEGLAADQSVTFSLCLSNTDGQIAALKAFAITSLADLTPLCAAVTFE